MWKDQQARNRKAEQHMSMHALIHCAAISFADG
jgi:hypothetical protein